MNRLHRINKIEDAIKPKSAMSLIATTMEEADAIIHLYHTTCPGPYKPVVILDDFDEGPTELSREE